MNPLEFLTVLLPELDAALSDRSPPTRRVADGRYLRKHANFACVFMSEGLRSRLAYDLEL
jgi:hypothetical protein